MAGSAAELAIRDAVVPRLRQLFPGGRIVHELNTRGTGSSRIDLASISEDKIVAVEIKSEKDKLDRLGHQINDFTRCSDWLIVAAHRKHFADYREAGWRQDVPTRLLHQGYSFAKHLWCFPKADDGRVDGHFKGDAEWALAHDRYLEQPEPRAADLLAMLWADELREECERHGFRPRRGACIPDMMRALVWNLSGGEVCEAVCRQLRARAFKEADAPIPVTYDTGKTRPFAREIRA